MQDSRGNILWVDDEIHHLKPHILFLEEKGYNLIQATNGDDAIALTQENQFDLATNLFTSFGYFEKDADEQKAINAMASNLKKDGRRMANG